VAATRDDLAVTGRRHSRQYPHRTAPPETHLPIAGPWWAAYNANEPGGRMLVTTMGTTVVMTGRIIALQRVIPPPLVWCEDGSLCEMRPKVHSTQLPMNGRNLTTKLLDLCL
jgi:hypothetical protein